MTQVNSTYRGRFAPSPTGPLHIGSLTTALGSYLQAKKNHGKWLVRIDDLDPPRVMAGAVSEILRLLEYLGLTWDEDVVYQSKRGYHYESALDSLNRLQRLYACQCSRKTIAAIARPGVLGNIYPGTCRHKSFNQQNVATRLITDNESIFLKDLLQAPICQNIHQDIGDIVLKRADGLYAYHLAVCVDDYLQQITEVVRGFDLFSCSPTQIYLQRLLNYPTPDFLHLPIIINSDKQKLSKQNKAKPVVPTNASVTLYKLLIILNQNPPDTLLEADKEAVLTWAIDNWQIDKCRLESIQAPDV